MMNDLVSRKAALDAVRNLAVDVSIGLKPKFNRTAVMDVLLDLPSVAPIPERAYPAWVLEAHSFYRDTYDESIELAIYITARCSKCGRKHPDSYQVFSKTLYAPDDATEDFRFNQEEEEQKALREFESRNFKFAKFCPECGEMMVNR